MSEAKQVSESEAIRQVIAETNAFDFADIVNAVHKRFRIDVTAAQVEEIYRELQEGQPARKEDQPAQAQIPQPRTTVSMVASVPMKPLDDQPAQKENKPAQSQIPQPRTTVSMVASVPTKPLDKSPEPVIKTESSPAETVESQPKDDFDHALQFVKSVGGLAKAKQVLNDLESALLGSD